MKKYLNISTVLLLIFSSCKNQVSNNSNDGGFLQPISECVSTDSTPPVMDTTLLITDSGSRLTSPTVEWQEAQEACDFSHYEVSIGTSIGSSDILSFINIGNSLSFSQNYLDLDYSQNYFYNVVAVDRAGNRSTKVSSSPWMIFSAKTLTKLVLWLDASEKNTIKDNEGDSPEDLNFSNDVKTWLDQSNSNAIHNFSSIGSSLPSYDVREGGVRFNGSQQFMATADHADINTSIIGQRTIVATFKTSDDISSRQVIYEEGGTVRGINIYIEDNKLRCGFWNIQNDGDGAQPYIEVSDNINKESLYVVTYLFDYSHFLDRNSTDGTVECFINGSSSGQVMTSSRLHPHSGDIGLGAMNDGSYFLNTGAISGDESFFDGVLYEFLIYNSAHSKSDLDILNQTLQDKWIDE